MHKSKTVYLITTFILIRLVLIAIPVAAQDPTATAETSTTNTPTDTPTPIPTDTPTSLPTDTPTPLPTDTPTPTPTPTVTPVWPTDTPTPVPIWTPTPETPDCLDSDEPLNNQPGAGQILVINQVITDLTLSPMNDVDFFLLWAKAGRYYEITTGSSDGVDTRLRAFDPGGSLVAENDDYKTGSVASQVTFMTTVEGWYMVSVDSKAPMDWTCRRYNIKAIDIELPTPTPTLTGTPALTRAPTGTMTPIPERLMPDEYEPNYDFNTAANIGVGQTIALNFNGWPAGSPEVDNDFFRLYVKQSEELLIETQDLAEGLDTNLIIFREDGNVVTGNDDCQAGERRSCIEWLPDYAGVAYILAGPVGTIPDLVSEGARAYKLSVTDQAGENRRRNGGNSRSTGLGATPRAISTSSLYGQPLPWKVTPLAATPTAAVEGIPFLLETPQPGEGSKVQEKGKGEVQVRSFSLAPATSTPRPLQPLNIEVTIYYDANNNRAPDMSEGVAGVSVRVLDAASNRLLAQTFTDNQGHATSSLMCT